MLDYIDNFLNKTTMYRLTLYYLAFLLFVAVIFCSLGILPYSPFALIISVLIILAVCLATNAVFSAVFSAPVNNESTYITALILALIIAPPSAAGYLSNFPLLAWASIWAMASKYIFAFRKKHVFNPAAFAVALTALTINQSANWWVGGLYMLPFVVVGGLLVVRKTRRFNLVAIFFAVAALTVSAFNFFSGSAGAVTAVQKLLFYTPLPFFAFTMLTEPLTSPSTKTSRLCYGAIAGFLFAPFIHVGAIYSTPELALLAGNIFAFLANPKGRWILKLKNKTRIATDICEFSFGVDRKLPFSAGQYLELTLPHEHPDSRGNRRYFTVVSSPTEENVKLGIKFYSEPSSFKKSLMAMKAGDEIIASNAAGDFVLPKNKEQKLVFIAGGIGITPFISMLRYLIGRNEKRPIAVFYSNLTVSDIVYSDVLNAAETRLGIKIVFALTNPNLIPDSWTGQRGFVNEQMIAAEVPDYKERLFYVSGPPAMVSGVEKILRNAGIPKKRIKTDFFPGFGAVKKSGKIALFAFWAAAVAILIAGLTFYSLQKL